MGKRYLAPNTFDENRPTFLCSVWQSLYKEEDHYTFRTVPREHWSIGSVHGTPKLTIKKLRPAGFARTAQFITTKLYSFMVLLITLSNATTTFNTILPNNRGLFLYASKRATNVFSKQGFIIVRCINIHLCKYYKRQGLMRFMFYHGE